MAARFPMAVVVVGSPLTVTIEGASAVVAAEDFVGGLRTGDRVQAAFLGDRLTVLAKAGGNGPNPNLLYNSTFMVNQQGYGTGRYVNAGDYGFDGWKATTTTSRMYFTPKAQTVEVAIVGSFTEVVERSKIWPGDQHTLSWTGTAQARVYNSGGTAPAYASSPITVTLDGTADVLVEWGAGTLKWPKFERGAIATPYVLPNYDDDLTACQRYYIKSGDTIYLSCGNGGLSNSYAGSVFFPTQMRSAPTLTVYSGADQTGTSGSATWYPGGTAAAVTVSQLTKQHFSPVRIGTSTSTLCLLSYVADARL